VNTGAGCHLDAEMVARALPALKPPPGAVVLIENVGNLVCPALFDLGELAKVVIFSVPEGEDKPLKYPHMFRAASVVILNKIDLLPHLEFSLMRAIANVQQVNPKAAILQISSRTGEGVAGWYDWVRAQLAIARQSAFT
jgi:hydrogenase nickel incorporation protein HypB